MDSRGRFMVKMCQEDNSSKGENKTIKQQEQSTVSPQKHNIITCQKSPSEINNHVSNDVNFAVDITPDVLNLPEHDEFKIITCESAPASIMASEMISNNFKPPQSAPMPVNVSPMSLCSSKINLNEDENISVYNYKDVSSPVRGSSPISGVEPMRPSTDEEPFSDSGSSWIPDSEEEIKIKRKRTSLMKMRFEDINSIPSSDSEDETSKIITTRAIIETPIDQVSLVNPDRRTMKHDVTIAETTDTETETETGNKEKKIYRWKKSNQTNWKRNKELQKKRKCLPYKSKTGKLCAAKLPKSPKCSNSCRQKCTEKFTQNEREIICKHYWSIQDYKLQKEFLLKRIIIKPVQTTRKSVPIDKQRSTSRQYGFYKNKTVFEQVCKNYFMSTLCISTGPIETAVKHVDDHGAFTKIDNRGRQAPANKTPEEQIQDVKDHIESFPVIDSHYCRKKSNRKYLEPTLSISKMYDLYVQKMKKNNKVPVKFNIYKKVFGTQYNLAFYHPKKDQCSTCNNYNKDKSNINILNEYTQHIERKEASYRSKELDKKRSEEDDSYLCVTMDLQSLLQIPSTADSLMYYSRKLNLYNLSIYEFKPPQNDAHCMIWTEINGKRGSVEIASAIYLWIKNLPEAVTHVTLYSDTCSGQNRNQYIAAFLLYLVHTHRTIKVLEQKYLESGHSYMEVDSMHSAIEKEKKYTDTFSIIDWKGIMQRARSKRQNKNVNPYKVTELSYQDMIDVKSLSSKIIKNTTIAENGEKVCWLKIKCLRFQKDLPGFIKYRYDYDGPYNLLNALCKPGRPTRRTQNSEMPTINTEDLPRAYKQCLPITKQKKKDLLQLCKKNIIPKELHGWYEGLPCLNEDQGTPPCTDSSEVDD
ncbi:unnamed protein product [Spodoptera littoralis]|uniref:DUF7869 domain-containing protein n=1 Tax=Spodoptera littoralis TaxID=7109 RepID=A0A9P0N6H5_SPOLI|nr:unnamed protein product [Spodoptera littoralis]CAH1643294.1 unnamed protein product [Spodoptera littoralis]